MKKWKECLFFVVPLVVLIAIPIVICLFAVSQEIDMYVFAPAPLNYWNYLKLFLDDDLFWRAFFNTYGKAMLFSFLLSFAAIAAFTLIRYSVKIPLLNRARVYHPVHVALGIVISFAVSPVNKIRLLGVQTDPFLEVISSFEVIFTLQVAVFAAFVFWLIELTVARIRSRKAVKI